MKSILIILGLQIFVFGETQSQSLTVDDLVNLASLPSQNAARFMNKKGFVLSCSKTVDDTLLASFTPKTKKNKKDFFPDESVDLRFEPDTKSYMLSMFSASKYINGRQSLIKDGFFCADKENISQEKTPMLFQKANITIQATSGMVDSIPQYIFVLKQKKIPSEISFAEDLLQFDSYEYLASFFGRQNIRNDLYYFSQNELKKCSVLFNGTKRQAVFVWGDEHNLNHLSYIIVSNKIPTEGAEEGSALTGNSSWQFQNGMYLGMDIKELLKLNKGDFDIYGNKSDLAFMVKPTPNGKINFIETAVMLNCNLCNEDKIFDQQEVSALEIAKENLPMKIFDIIIYPAK